jgi:hypothetical protein
MLDEIRSEGCIRSDTLIPQQHPELFTEREVWERPPVKTPTDKYILGIEESLPYFPLLEVFYNAFERGNKRREDLPIQVEVFSGSKGMVLRITDAGEGFDFRDVMEKRKSGEKYFNSDGHGLNVLDLSGFNVAYEGRGNVVNMQVFV